MALATTCPSCSTSFKVHPEQLKLRRGLVRCGVCQHVFSGIKYVRYVSDAKKRSRRRRRKPAHAVDAQTTQASQPVAPETVVDDLHTAFFLPETRMDTTGEDDSQAAGTQTSKQKSDSEGNNQREAASNKKRQGRRNRRKSRRKNNNGADQATQTASSPASDQPLPVERPAAPTVDSVVVSRSRSTDTQRSAEPTDRPARHADSPPASSVVPVVPDPAPPMAFGSQPDEAFADTLQANLPTAWHTGESAIAWPDLDDNVATDRVPARSAEPTDADVDTDGDTTISDDTSVETAESFTEADSKTSSARSKREHADTAAPGDLENDNDTSVVEADESSNNGLSTEENQSHALAPSQQTDEAQDRDDPLSHDQSQTDQSVYSQEQPHVDEEDAIDYFGRTSRPAFDFDLPPRNVQLLAVALAVLLGLQLVIGARDSLAARFSFTRPALETLASPLGLTIKPPVQVDDVKILSLNVSGPVSSDQENDTHAYIMNLLLRNTGQLTAQWPAVELVVTDQSGGRLVQKVLMPVDYLNDTDRAAAGMSGNTEEYVRLNMRAHGIMITNIYGLLFYP